MKKKKKIKASNKLAGWMFHTLYWFDMYRIKKSTWKDLLRKKYIDSGMSKQFKKGTFKKTWSFIKKEGLIREGRKSSAKKRRRCHQEE